MPFSSPGRMVRVVCDIEISILDFLHNFTPAGNLFVGSVLESSCTGVYTLVLRSDPPPTFLAGASSARSLFFAIGYPCSLCVVTLKRRLCLHLIFALNIKVRAR